MEGVEWYYVRDGQQVGPISFASLQNEWTTGISQETYVWCCELDNWKPIGECSELLKLLCPPKSRTLPPIPQKPSSLKQTSISTNNNIDRNETSVIQKNQLINSFNSSNSYQQTNSHISTQYTSTIWEERFTVDDVPYYYNTKEDILSWDKPDCLLTDKEKQDGKRKWVWIENEQEGWIPICVESENNGKVSGYSDNGSYISSSKIAGVVHWNSLHELPNDIVLLEDCDEPSILYTIKQRYLKNQIYTWVGSNKSILVSINPFQQLPLYSPEIIQEHAHPPPNKQLTPHVYDIAYSAYSELCYNQTNQSILISGESGAGKTEATKQCLGFIAEIAGSDSSLEQKILQTNPILESFGNAKTVRNNNSSRFGKWIEVHFNDQNKICGASIECYLLEKSRVVTQQENERSFHIFYQLFTSPILCKQYHLESIESYRYLTEGHCLTVNGLDDEQQLIDTLSSFEALNFTKQEIDSIISLLVGILKLGNIQFVETGENSLHPETKVQNNDLLDEVASLLMIPEEDLENTICIRKITVKEGFSDKTTCIPLSCKEAIQNCDALAKELYSRLFDWIVMRLNQSLNGERNKFIGFLDIFGFEIFKTNSFEQLCINYANERLQKLFNNSTFKEEETVYQREGIQFNHIQYSDNEEVLEMLENRYGGLFCAIDDQVKMRNGTDINLMKNIRNTLSKYHCFNGKSKADNQFSIDHYAGLVNYTIDGFTDKNRDRIFDNLYTLIASSSSPFISSLFPRLANQGKTTVCAKFQKQLNDLVCILEASERKYIRCIKPNDQKKKLIFDNVHTLEQLRYSGIFEAVKIRKLGYPFRLTFDQFIHRYRCLPMVKSIPLPSHASTNQLINCIIDSRPECKEKIFIGRTLVLYKATEHKILELARNLALDRLLPCLQSVIKRKLACIALPLFMQIESDLQAAIDTKQVNTIEESLKNNEVTIQQVQQLIGKSIPMVKKAKDAIIFLQRMQDLENTLMSLLNSSILSNITPLMNTIEELESQPDLLSEHLLTVIQDAKTKIRQFAASLIEPDLREALYSLEREQIEKLINQANDLNYSSETVNEGKRLLALADEEFFQLEIERAEQMGDISRLVDRKIKLRDLLLHKNEEKYSFTRYPALKTPEEYASHKILTMNRKWWRETAFSFISLIIPTCLSNVPKEYEKKGITLFKTIQGYMKDRKYNVESNQLAFEIIITLNKPDVPACLRTEVYCQLIKQLTDNPSSQSISLGFDLLAILLYYVLPEEQFINYIIVFIWKNCKEPEKYMNVLNNSYYSSKYKRNSSYKDGCRIIPSSTQEIDSFLTEFNMNMKRYSIETKLASYGESIAYSDYSAVPMNSYSTLRPSSPAVYSSQRASSLVSSTLRPSSLVSSTLRPSSPTSYSTLRPATTTTLHSSTASSTLRPSSPTSYSTLRPATTSTLRPSSPSAYSTLRPSSPSARASASTTLRPSTASHRSPSPSYRPSSSYATLRPATTSTLRQSSPTPRQSSPAPRPITTTTHNTVHSTSSLQRPHLPAPSRPAPAPPKPRKETALVLYDITLDINPNVLVCNEGDQIIIEEDCGEWLRATLNGKEGYVPYNYIQRTK